MFETYFFNLLGLVGGLALFLFGMNVMGNALERRAGNGLKSLLGKLTSNKFLGFLTGVGVIHRIGLSVPIDLLLHWSNNVFKISIIAFMNILTAFYCTRPKEFFDAVKTVCKLSLNSALLGNGNQLVRFHCGIIL